HGRIGCAWFWPAALLCAAFLPPAYGHAGARRPMGASEVAQTQSAGPGDDEPGGPAGCHVVPHVSGDDSGAAGPNGPAGAVPLAEDAAASSSAAFGPQGRYPTRSSVLTHLYHI